jgi:hypothetical protein
VQLIDRLLELKRDVRERVQLDVIGSMQQAG